MTRIIAGVAGSLRLEVPHQSTRPTSDRVREAIFSALESRMSLIGARVLDLYAGSGALGFEALSRGAASLTAVESHRDACRVLHRNRDTLATALDASVSVDIRCQPVSAALQNLSAEDAFDLVLIDPPYDLDHDELCSNLELLAAHVSDEALVVVERRAQPEPGAWPDGYEVLAEKTYGDTRVVTLSR